MGYQIDVAWDQLLNQFDDSKVVDREIDINVNMSYLKAKPMYNLMK